jgi:hypothetical protein
MERRYRLLHQIYRTLTQFRMWNADCEKSTAGAAFEKPIVGTTKRLAAVLCRGEPVCSPKGIGDWWLGIRELQAACNYSHHLICYIL